MFYNWLPIHLISPGRLEALWSQVTLLVHLCTFSEPSKVCGPDREFDKQPPNWMSSSAGERESWGTIFFISAWGNWVLNEFWKFSVRRESYDECCGGNRASHVDSGKEFPCQCRRCGFDPWGSGGEDDNQLQYSCWKSHGQGSLAGCSPWGLKEPDMTEHRRAGRYHYHWLIPGSTLHLGGHTKVGPHFAERKQNFSLLGWLFNVRVWIISHYTSLMMGNPPRRLGCQVEQ